MSALKQLPPRRRKLHATLLGLVIAVVIALGWLHRWPEKAPLLVFVSLFFILLTLVLLAAVVGRPFCCPDCGKFLREGGDHPKCNVTYLYHCHHCDIIWDTLIPRSHG